MRHDKINAAAVAPKSLRPSIFICTCCETSEHSLSEDLPPEWSIEFLDGTAYAFCGDCKIDVPDENGTPSPLTTRLGVTSPLDLADLIECDPESLRHMSQYAAFAAVERIGRAIMPALLTAIGLGIAACMVAQGTKWITV